MAAVVDVKTAQHVEALVQDAFTELRWITIETRPGHFPIWAGTLEFNSP